MFNNVTPMRLAHAACLQLQAMLNHAAPTRLVQTGKWAMQIRLVLSERRAAAAAPRAARAALHDRLRVLWYGCIHVRIA
jgi:hypothetical protein